VKGIGDKMLAILDTLIWTQLVLVAVEEVAVCLVARI